MQDPIIPVPYPMVNSGLRKDNTKRWVNTVVFPLCVPGVSLGRLDIRHTHHPDIEITLLWDQSMFLS
jgi:hypothetical protein